MKKILYVEDNEDNIYVLKMMLEKKGYNIVFSGDGLDAVNKAKTEKPDIILMDVGLPIIDGYQATKILKSDPETKNIPIIMLTAHALVSDEQKSEQVGAEDFETKPINHTRLLEKIVKFIGN